MREKYGIITYPINSIDLCNKIGNIDIVIHNLKTPGFCGLAIKGIKRDTIILNSNRNDSEQNFDCCHELVHLFKHSKSGENEFNCCLLKKQNSFIEWEANEGAAELLLPYKILLPIIKENWLYLNHWSTIYDFKMRLSGKFRIPFAVVENRLSNLKYEIYQYMNGVELEEIKFLSNNEQKKRGIIVESLNDIEKDSFNEESMLFTGT